MEVSRIFEGGCSAMALTMFALGLASLKYEIPERMLSIDPGLKVRAIFIFFMWFQLLKNIILCRKIRQNTMHW